MNIRKVISNLLCFFLSTRQINYSEKIAKIAKKNDLYILVPNERDKYNFENPEICISLGDLNKMNGKDLIIILDNYTILKIFENLQLEIESLDKTIELKKETISQYDYLINEIEYSLGKINSYRGKKSNNDSKLPRFDSNYRPKY